MHLLVHSLLHPYLAVSGIHVFEKYIEMITPDDITKIPQLQLIYEGKLREYKQHNPSVYNPNLFDWNHFKANF